MNTTVEPRPSHQGIEYRKPVYDRSADDFYTEPLWAVEALFDNERIIGKVWDPAAGAGTVMRVCNAREIDCEASDLVDRNNPSVTGDIDFLGTTSLHDLICPVDNIVTNPPFRLAEKFIRRALEVTRFKVCVLLRLSFLESVKRADLFDSTTLARVHIFRRRVSMPPGGSDIEAKGGTIAFAWFVWDLDHQGPPSLHWLD